jgi:hypothetical protein
MVQLAAMADNIYIDDRVAYLPGAEASVFFSPSAKAFGNGGGTALAVKKLQNSIPIVPWGEDNRFPQNIANLLSACGIAKAGLDWKARALWGQGIIPVKVLGYEQEGNKEIVAPLDRIEYAEVYKFIETRQFYRFYLEFLQDWVWYGNCFPELLLSLDHKSIIGIVHQESCDVRYQEMNDAAIIENVYLSKVWGASKDQYNLFNPDRTVPGVQVNPAFNTTTLADTKLYKTVPAIDMYNALASAKAYADALPDNAMPASFILPVNYPSPGKTYYQTPNWDAARLAGWIDIVIKIPAMMLAMLNNAFHIKYHIEIPEEYFNRRFPGYRDMDYEKRKECRSTLINEMNTFLKGSDKAGSAFLSYFDSDVHSGNEYNRIKINTLEHKVTIDKEAMATAAGNAEIMFAMGINPDILGASMPGGAYGGNKGGSNIREGKLVYDSMLTLERNVILEPLYLVRDFNGWDPDIQFRFRDTILTTLDKNTGTQKTLS